MNKEPEIEYIEATEIRKHLDAINNYLLTLSKKERLAWFKRTMYVQPLEFTMEIDNTTYISRAFFDTGAGETIFQKVERIALKK